MMLESVCSMHFGLETVYTYLGILPDKGKKTDHVYLDFRKLDPVLNYK